MTTSEAKREAERGNRRKRRQSLAQSAADGDYAEPLEGAKGANDEVELITRQSFGRWEPQGPIDQSLHHWVKGLALKDEYSRQLVKLIARGDLDRPGGEVIIGKTAKMKHGTSIHILKFAIDKELGLSQATTGDVAFDALWVSPWEECAMGYPEKLERKGIYYGEVAWSCRGRWGPPLRAVLYVEAMGPLPPEATPKQIGGALEGWARAKKGQRYKHPQEPGAGNDQYVHNSFRLVGFKIYRAEREVTTGSAHTSRAVSYPVGEGHSEDAAPGS